MTDGGDPAILLVIAGVALAWRILGVGELLRRPRRERPPYDPDSRPWGKGW